MKSVATVQLPVARFQVIVSDITDDEELGLWVRKFARALALADPELEPFASELLKDVENYREANARKKREAKARMEQRMLVDSATSVPLPKNMDEVLDYAHDEGLFDDEWVKWWANENFKKGKGRLPDGQKIVNWKRQLVKAFNTKKKENENETRD